MGTGGYGSIVSGGGIAWGEKTKGEAQSPRGASVSNGQGTRQQVAGKRDSKDTWPSSQRLSHQGQLCAGPPRGQDWASVSPHVSYQSWRRSEELWHSGGLVPTGELILRSGRSCCWTREASGKPKAWSSSGFSMEAAETGHWSSRIPAPVFWLFSVKEQFPHQGTF